MRTLGSLGPAGLTRGFFQTVSRKVRSGLRSSNTQGTGEGLCRGRGLTGWPRRSHGPGLGFNLLLPVQALWVLELGHALSHGDLGAAAVQAVQVDPGLLRNLPVVGSCGAPEARRSGLRLRCPLTSPEPNSCPEKPWTWQWGLRELRALPCKAVPEQPRDAPRTPEGTSLAAARFPACGVPAKGRQRPAQGLGRTGGGLLVGL